MRAAVFHRYGPPDVVRVLEVPTPDPAAGEVRVRIIATTVSSGDVRLRSLRLPAGFGPFGRPLFGLRGPRQPILGTEFSGIIDALGPGVTRFAVGDAVFGFPGGAMGCHAEYRVMPEAGRILPIAHGLSFAQAAALSFGGTTALCFLRDRAHLQPGESVLIIGASGAVGSAAVQLAKHFGATVSAVASGANSDLLRSLGADHVIDYRAGPFLDGRQQYDVIFETVGSTGRAACLPALRPGGRLLLGAAGLGDMIGANLPGRAGTFAGPASERLEDLATLADLAAAGAWRPLIDRHYPLAEIAAAHAYVDAGHKRGSVIIDVHPAPAAT